MAKIKQKVSGACAPSPAPRTSPRCAPTCPPRPNTAADPSTSSPNSPTETSGSRRPAEQLRTMRHSRLPGEEEIGLRRDDLLLESPRLVQRPRPLPGTTPTLDCSRFFGRRIRLPTD